MSESINKVFEFFKSHKESGSPLLPAISYKVRNIDGTNTGTTLLFTTASDNFIATEIVVDLTSVSGFTSSPTISVGDNSSSYDNIMSATAINSLTNSTDHLLIRLSGISPDVTRTTQVFINIQGVAVATQYTFDITMVGFYN